MGFGWSLVAFYIENDGWMQFCGVTRIGDGYIQQEVQKLKQQYFEKKENK